MCAWAGVALIVVAFSGVVYCETFAECDGVEDKSFVADPKDCESYIYCDDEDSFASKCPTNLRFNVENGSCDDAENVECLSQETSPTTTTTTSTEKSTTIERRSSTITTGETATTSKPTSSVSETPATSTSSTSNTRIRSTSTLPPSSITTLSSSTITSNEAIVCPKTSKPEEIIYLPSSESCSEYYMCYRGTPIPMTCPNDLEFSLLKGSCDWARLANCKIAGTTTTSPRELCAGQTTGFFTYSGNCHYYYRCMNGMLTIQECPLGFGWDLERKMCSSTACQIRL